MIDPAGDAKHAGREIDDCFERGITLQCAEVVKKKCEKKYSNVRVVLTRFPGESLEPLQNASFANRLGIDCYISIHFYPETEPKPRLYLFYFMYHPTDIWQQPSDELILRPYDQAHLFSLQISKMWGYFMKFILEQDQYKKFFDIKGLFGIPFKPLIGVTSPALGIEIGLKYKNDWQKYVEPIVNSLEPIIKELRS